MQRLEIYWTVSTHWLWHLSVFHVIMILLNQKGRQGKIGAYRGRLIRFPSNICPSGDAYNHLKRGRRRERGRQRKETKGREKKKQKNENIGLG